MLQLRLLIDLEALQQDIQVVIIHPCCRRRPREGARAAQLAMTRH
jgi:hypothetical protein